jgi:hypothetical protein
MDGADEDGTECGRCAGLRLLEPKRLADRRGGTLLAHLLAQAGWIGAIGLGLGHDGTRHEAEQKCRQHSSLFDAMQHEARPVGRSRRGLAATR